MRKYIKKACILILATAIMLTDFPINLNKQYTVVAEERIPKLINVKTGLELKDYERFSESITIEIVYSFCLLVGSKY